jgi:hypothetical protein
VLDIASDVLLRGKTSLREGMTMHDARSIRLPLVAALAVVVVASSAVAAPRCEKPCKAETAACIGERCAGLGGAARHACLETCRGIGGCARVRTLAYVVGTCTVHGFHQTLQIRHGDCDPLRLWQASS